MGGRQEPSVLLSRQGKIKIYHRPMGQEEGRDILNVNMWGPKEIGLPKGKDQSRMLNIPSYQMFINVCSNSTKGFMAFTSCTTFFTAYICDE